MLRKLSLRQNDVFLIKKKRVLRSIYLEPGPDTAKRLHSNEID